MQPLFLFIFRAEIAAGAVALGLHLQLLAFQAHRGAGGHRLGDKCAGTDNAALADHRFAAQNSGIGIDGHIILNGGVTALAPQTLSAPGGKTAKGHTLVDLHILADHCGLTNNDTCAVVDEEIFANGSAGVNIDTGDTVGMLRHNSGNHGYIKGI